MCAAVEFDARRIHAQLRGQQLPQAAMRDYVARPVLRRMEARCALTLGGRKDRGERLALRGGGIEGEAVERTAGRCALFRRKLPGGSRRGVAQRPNPEARRGSSGALSVSLL